MFTAEKSKKKRKYGINTLLSRCLSTLSFIIPTYHQRFDIYSSIV